MAEMLKGSHRTALAADAAEAARRQRAWAPVTPNRTGEAVIASDAEGIVTFLDPAAESLTGWRRAEAAGHSLGEVFFLVHEATRRPLTSPVKGVLARGVGAGLAEHALLVSLDGSARPIAGSAAPICDGPGNLLGVVVVFRDVGPERKAEREREALLARARAACAEAEGADRRKDQFLASLGHELRSLLESLDCALHVLGLQGHDDAVRGPMCALAARQVAQLHRIVDGLLDLARIRQGKVELRKVRVNLLDVVARAVETARPVVERFGHELVVTVPPGPAWLHADPGRLEQVLVNLVQNAAKYTARGGRIDLKVERAGGEVTMRVKDTGIGIDSAMLGRVFDLYTQVEGTREYAQGGLGIGLALARGLVALHGGTLDASSDGLGHGSEFVARLPADAGVRAEAGPAVSACARLPGKALRLLLADDDRDGLEAMALLLRLWGHGVQTAPDGPSALAAARAGLPDVVLLDISLPGMDGHEVARRLRREPGLERAFLVALTGHAHEEDHRLSREAGFDIHLDKPVDLDVLEQLLAHHGAVAPAERA